MVISNDEVLHLTDKVQSLSKKSAGNRPANTSSLMNYIKSLSGNTKGMALYGRDHKAPCLLYYRTGI